MHRNPTEPTFSRSLAAQIQRKAQGALRVVLSQYVINGLSVSLGLVLIMLALFETAGLAAAASAAVGVITTSLPDVPSPRRRKIMQVLPAPLLGAPLFMLVQLTRQDELLLGGVLVAGTFLAVMMMAWGKRGGPICFALLFSMLFSMAAPTMASLEQVLSHTGWFLAGAVLYLLWAVLTTHLLNQPNACTALPAFCARRRCASARRPTTRRCLKPCWNSRPALPISYKTPVMWCWNRPRHALASSMPACF